ncbi:uncharacterized protein BP5553_03643 [Venustampulla echinocandica]|uniref:Uncharacterized protein n=1 Tax=Venustampulla echinocandica TaxID=2656787 RepID=A0A370TUU1_9HELO|nr:uncharacterized protein BP5553_03643 [Venustampulla echinocandica]RDL39303.1 hypothetical protein BP5553_03643 [Venustampulla echinocandica]
MGDGITGPNTEALKPRETVHMTINEMISKTKDRIARHEKEDRESESGRKLPKNILKVTQGDSKFNQGNSQLAGDIPRFESDNALVKEEAATASSPTGLAYTATSGGFVSSYELPPMSLANMPCECQWQRPARSTLNSSQKPYPMTLKSVYYGHHWGGPGGGAPSQAAMNNVVRGPAQTAQLALQHEDSELRRDNSKLNKELSKLRRDHARIKEEDAVLKQKYDKLKQDKKELKEERAMRENFQIIEENSSLKQEIADLKNQIELQSPLVKSAVAIRLRFWEQAKEALGLGVGDRSIIAAGNIAAHHGDALTDGVMVSLGYLKVAPENNVPEQHESEFERNLETFTKMYAMDPSYYNSLSPQQVEIANMGATMLIWRSTGGVDTDSSLVDWGRFDELYDDCCLIFDALMDETSPLDILRATIDTDFTISEKLRQMKHIFRRADRYIKSKRTSSGGLEKSHTTATDVGEYEGQHFDDRRWRMTGENSGAVRVDSQNGCVGKKLAGTSEAKSLTPDIIDSAQKTEKCRQTPVGRRSGRKGRRGSRR